MTDLDGHVAAHVGDRAAGRVSIAQTIVLPISSMSPVTVPATATAERRRRRGVDGGLQDVHGGSSPRERPRCRPD